MVRPDAVSASGSSTVDSALWSRRIAAGDEAAFTAFYTAWFAPTLALARAVGRRDEGWCLDIVQDVMFTVARKLPALATEAAVGAWLSKAVRCATVDRLRREQRRQRREQRFAAASGLAGAEEPWQDLVAAEQQAWLGARLEELSSADRALLAARFGASVSVTAAGATFGLGADAAHGRLRRALARMRQSAAEWWHGGP